MCDSCYGDHEMKVSLGSAFFSKTVSCRTKSPPILQATALVIMEQKSYLGLDNIRDRGGCFEMQPQSANRDHDAFEVMCGSCIALQVM